MRYLFTTVPGLEDVAVEELASVGATQASAVSLTGRVIAEVPAPPTSLLGLRSVEKFGVFVASGSFRDLADIASGVMAHMGEIKEYLSPNTSVGVSCERAGKHPFKSRDVEAAVGRLFKEAGYPINLVDPDVEVNVDVVGDAYYVWITSTKSSLKDRGRPYQHYAALNPIVAFAMAKLARVKDGETVCDLTCGGGTICLEAARAARVRCICVDISLKHLRGALQNFKAEETDADVLWFDSTKLHRAMRPVCDVFLFNPPYGVRIPADIHKLYRGLAKSISALARGGARVAVVTPRWRAFLKYFRGEVWERRVIYQGGIYSSIVVGSL
ncbi:THUMP domain-containing class I SAM-dependent methyltransferase [Thermoproteus tenax]|uniref:Predicted N6-adenine-specific DNA methylase n=1 Tax=Thermoproteus tenax (strain ATCC 35583 / DSM 2078 / JCM 9277 / NBRC 100435 / Kra 1) TaxID=768679 RepID=G4RJG7_THETK|nr:THUMP domain-containing protein [Thermoproteus tenax]CCC81712.1 Predicted N6-adenine-specific DNA methylase [Thermoproteus tenax Kra 1]